MQGPITIVLIAITCIVSWMALSNRKLLDRLILWPPAIEKNKQYDRLLTYGFIHGDFMHLFFNMLTLYFFGRTLEMKIIGPMAGPWAYLAFYLSALVVSILPTYLKNQRNPNYLSLGASGAVSAVLFAYILISPWSMIFVFFIPMPAIVFAVLYVAYSIWMDKRGGDRINHSAHLAGAAYGILFMIMMEPKILPYFLEQLSKPNFGG